MGAEIERAGGSAGTDLVHEVELPEHDLEAIAGGTGIPKAKELPPDHWVPPFEQTTPGGPPTGVSSTADQPGVGPAANRPAADTKTTQAADKRFEAVQTELDTMIDQAESRLKSDWLDSTLGSLTEALRDHPNLSQSKSRG